MTTPTTYDPNDSQAELPPAQPMDEFAVKLRGVSKGFADRPIYNKFDLDIRRGETMCILGPSGTGKSVLLKLIIGLHKPEEGQIFIDGQDIVPLSERAMRDVRRKVGMLFQGAALFDSMNVGENVAYGLREYTNWPKKKIAARVAECLEQVGLPGAEKKWPAALSGGMQKRVGLARALAPGPSVILYDEPATGLDPANSLRIQELIMKLQKDLKVTSIVITHNLGLTMRISDRIALVADGKLILLTDKETAKEHPPAKLESFMRGEEVET